MPEICRYCPNECGNVTPVNFEGEPINAPVDIIGCVRWTCLFGKRRARQALLHGERQDLTLLDGSQVTAVAFGSDDKPTDDGEFKRFVTLVGDIIANDANGGLFYTGQTIYQKPR